MKAKSIGSITSHQKRVGKFYKPPHLQPSLKQSRKTNYKLQNEQIKTATTIQLKRCKSVGKIYSLNKGQKREMMYQSGRMGYNNLINYDEMENKLSSYLTCAIRTNGRQKYNYLGQNYRPFSNEKCNYQRQTFNDWQMNDKMRMNKFLLQRQKFASNEGFLKENNFANTAPLRESFQKKDLKDKVQLCKEIDSKKGKQNRTNYEPLMKGFQAVKKDTHKLFSINHQQQKCDLQNKLKKIIENYQTKNKQLSNQMNLLQVKLSNQKVQNSKIQKKEGEKHQICSLEKEQGFNHQFLIQIVTKLIEFNLKTICLALECQHKQTLWKSIQQQILLDQKLRIAKLLINQHNISKVLEFINTNRLKKLDVTLLKVHTEQYDPFLVQKSTQLLSSTNLSKIKISKWIADNFIKCFEQSQRHWIKYLSQQKMQCEIKALVLQKQVVSLRKVEGISRDLNLREFTRYLSTLFKANLRNRNLYMIYSKIKGLPYISRFIGLLQQKTSKISEGKKSILQK